VLTGAHDAATLASAPHSALIDDITALIDLLSRP
jgi:hypothetical protein